MPDHGQRTMQFDRSGSPPSRAHYEAAFKRFLDAREAYDVPATLRAQRDLRGLGLRVEIMYLRRPEGGGR